MAHSKTETRLFPVAHYYNSIILNVVKDGEQNRSNLTSYYAASQLTENTNLPNDRYTYSVSRRTPAPTISMCSHSVKLKSPLVSVLPNGYYFDMYETIEHLGNGQKNTKNSVAIFNALYNDISSCEIDPFIDPSHAAIITDRYEKHVICGMNTDRNALFAYRLVPSRSMVYEMWSNSGHPCDTYDLIGPYRQKQNEDAAFGTLVFKAEDPTKKISSFEGFPALPGRKLAISFTDGEVIYGHITNRGRFVQDTVLQDASEECKDITYFSAPQGLLIGYLPTKGLLRIWDVSADTSKSCDYEIPLLSNMRVSSNGQYLTGLEQKEEGGKDKVHCFRLKPFKHQVIQLKEPVIDFVIGFDNKVDSLTNNDDNEVLRESLGPIEALLQPRAPKPAESNRNSSSSFFDRFRRGKKDLAQAEDNKQPTP